MNLSIKIQILLKRCDQPTTPYLAKKEMLLTLKHFIKVNADHKSETQNIGDLIPALKAISGDAADRVSELQKLDR